jgi:LuxR family maltose regulon positive regulatory protein
MGQSGPADELEKTRIEEDYELLRTKIAPPRLNPHFVPRQALLARLDAGLEQKMTLISAPAGFGKTTLVSEWIAGLRKQDQLPPVAWVALDAGDNDPVRFWRYVLTACQVFGWDVGKSALALLRNSPQPSFEAILTLFINEAALLSDKAILVLEDYHLIDAPQIHATLAYLIDHLPDTLHLILMTRSDPALPLARLRAHNELNELRAADLRFTPEETYLFLKQTIPFPLPPQVTRRLAERTEGWAAGLRLVVLALRGRKDLSEIEQYLVSMTGSHRPIRDYLVADVFSALPEAIQVFLLQTSVLSRLTGPLCDAVTGRDDSALVLEQMEGDNLFLVSLDASQKWYRFHHLFAEAMQHLAQQRLGESRLCELFHKASSWYEAHGMLAEAVEACLSAKDFSRAAGLMERAIPPQFVNPEYYTLRRWLEQLPEEVLRTHPTLSFTYAVAILYTSNRRAPATTALLRTPLEMAEHHWRAEGNRPKLAQVLIFQTMAAWFQSNSLQALSGARQALEMLPEEDVFWRSVSLIGVGLEELLAGRMNEARHTLVEALATCKAAGNIYGALSATFFLGEVSARQGETGQAARLYRQVLEGISEDVQHLIVLLTDFDRGRALIGLGALSYEWNELETAQQYLSQALDIGRQLPDEELQVRSSLLLARLLHTRGETGQAQDLLQTLIAQTSPRWPLLLREARAGQAWLALAASDMEAVQHWHATWSKLSVEVPPFQQEQEQLIVARMLIAQGDGEMALHLLEGWQADAVAQGRVRSELEILLLTALAHFSQQNLTRARQALIEALALAQPGGYQRIFLDEKEPFAALLQETLSEIRDESLAAYAGALLYTIAQEQARQEAFTKVPAELLIEPLSQQEQRVLRMLAAGLTTPEIARELVVSANTVKTHVRNIYGKLGVKSRAEAAQAARHLKLLK